MGGVEMLIRFFNVVLVCGIILFGLSGCNSSKAMEEQNVQFQPSTPAVADSAETPSATTAASTTENSEATPSLPGVFQLSGVAKALRTSVLSSKIGGILTSIKAREGQRVVAGQVLCVIDTTDIALRAESAEIAAKQAKEALQNAKNDLARAEQLHTASAVAATTLEKAQLAVRLAELQAQAADVGLRMARQALADTNIRAPFSGVITKVITEEGQMITTMPPTMIFVLVDTDTLEVTVPIPERKLNQVKVGMPVSVFLPAKNFERKAVIDRISDVVDPVTRSAEAIIRVNNRDHSLPAGLYAQVSFPTISVDDGAAGGATNTPVAKNP
jgi:membrane fusion protein (multidrug efflux system)